MRGSQTIVALVWYLGIFSAAKRFIRLPAHRVCKTCFLIYAIDASLGHRIDAQAKECHSSIGSILHLIVPT